MTLYTSKEIAERYHISDKTALKLAQQGVLKATIFGDNALRFHLLTDDDGNPIERLYTAEEVAEQLKLNRQTIYRLVRDGKLDAIKLSERLIRFK